MVLGYWYNIWILLPIVLLLIFSPLIYLGHNYLGRALVLAPQGDLFLKKKKQKEKESRVGYYREYHRLGRKRKKTKKESSTLYSCRAVRRLQMGGEESGAASNTHNISPTPSTWSVVIWMGFPRHLFLIFRETRTAYNPQAMTITIV